MAVEFDSRRKKDRRKINTFLDKDKRKEDRRGTKQRKIDKKRRQEFKRHVEAQR